MRRARPRGAFVLLAMLVAIGAAMLVTSAVVWSARAEHAGRSASTDALRRRAAAWSAAQALAAEIGAQRPLVLGGGTPSLPPQLHLYDDGSFVATARLLPAAEDGRRLVAEAGLLDVNAAGADALTMVGLDDDVAALVLAARSRAGGTIGSLEEIVDRPGVAPTLLRGESAFAPETLAVIQGLRGAEQGRALVRAGSRLRSAGDALHGAGFGHSDGAVDDERRDGVGAGAGERRGAGAEARGASGAGAGTDASGANGRGAAGAGSAEGDAEPTDAGAESGGGGAARRRANDRGASGASGTSGSSASDDEAGDRGAIGSDAAALCDALSVFVVEPSISREGRPRAALGASWQEPIRERLATQLDDERLRRLDALAKSGFALDSDRALVECLSRLGIPPKEWGEILDEVTAEPGAWRWGRIDINHADGEVLASIPSLSAEQVQRILRERDGLDPAERANPAWPAQRGIVEPAAFAEVFPAITTRSFFWRVRFVAGFADADDPDGPLTTTSIWECVVDLTASRPRIAALRDLSMAPLLSRLLEEAPPRRESEASESAEAEGGAGADAAAGAPGESIGVGATRADAEPESEDPPGGSDRARDGEAPRSGGAARAGRASEAPGASRAGDDERPERRPSARRWSDPDREGRDASAAREGDAGAAAPAAEGRPSAPPPVGRYRPRPGSRAPSPASGATEPRDRSAPSADET